MLILKTNGRVNPIGIDDRCPEFSWLLTDPAGAARQAAWRIVVSCKTCVGVQDGLVWDSGEIRDDRSVEISYAGAALAPATRYDVSLRMTDDLGRTHEAQAFFETGLMLEGARTLGDGAKWIGAETLSLDAASASYFNLSMDVTIPEGGTRAGVVFGAGDWRLKNRNFNIWGRDGERQHFLYEVDLAGLADGSGEAAQLKIHVEGMPYANALPAPGGPPSGPRPAGGKPAGGPPPQPPKPTIHEPVPGMPAFVLPIPAEALNRENARKPIRIRIDTLANVNQVSCSINGVSVDERRQLNPLGNTHDYNPFPILNRIGFAVPAGQQAVYSNIVVRNPGPYSEGVLFDAATGGGYGIFEGLEGVRLVHGGEASGAEPDIHVGSDRDVLVHADPSHGAMPRLRREFRLKGRVAQARLYATSQGVHEIWINGVRVGEDWFNPGNTQYRERIAYATHDVTALLNDGAAGGQNAGNSNGRNVGNNDGQSGGTAERQNGAGLDNAIAVQLAEGWWSGYQAFIVHNYNYYGDRQALMARLVVRYEDGSTEAFSTGDDGWFVSTEGPVRAGSFFMGERYDARREAAMAGWTMPGYVMASRSDATRTAAAWSPAVEIPLEPAFENAVLTTRLDEPVRLVRTHNALDVRRTSENRDADGRFSYLYDMGENVLGVPRISLPKGALSAGRTLTIRMSEVLYPDNLPEYVETGLAGMPMVENYRAALSTDFYTAAGDDAVVVAPSCTFHGFRYLELSGLDEPLPLECVQTRLLSSIDISAEYESSNPLVNRLFRNIANSQRSNFLSLPTDCPQRNERLGWTGDAQIFSTAAACNADVYAFYRQWLQTLRDDQFPNGALPVFAPSFRQAYPDRWVLDANMFFCGVTWDAAILLIPWNLYRMTGKTGILRENLAAGVKYLDYLAANPMKVGDRVWDGLTEKTGILADWLGIEKTDHTLINNAVYAHLQKVASKIAAIVGDASLAARLAEGHERSKAQWNKMYVDAEGYPRDPDGNRQDTQAAYATPLRYGMFDAENEPKAVRHFAGTIHRTRTERGNFTVRTGFSGTPNLAPALSEHGLVEEAYGLFESTEYASWLYPVINGATSVWERWNSYTVEGGFNGNNSMNSFNHFSLGAILEWMVGHQLGIHPIEETPGFRRFRLQPQIGGRMTHVRGSVETPYGRIASGWTKDGEDDWATIEATVPFNAEAEAYLPVDGATGCEPLPACEGLVDCGETMHQGLRVRKLLLGAGGWRFRNTGRGIVAERVSER